MASPPATSAALTTDVKALTEALSYLKEVRDFIQERRDAYLGNVPTPSTAFDEFFEESETRIRWFHLHDSHDQRLRAEYVLATSTSDRVRLDEITREQGWGIREAQNWIIEDARKLLSHSRETLRTLGDMIKTAEMELAEAEKAGANEKNGHD